MKRNAGTDVTFVARAETEPGAAWQQLFATCWPGWRSWLARHKAEGTSDLRDAERRIRRHLPAYHPIWEQLTDIAGRDPLAARFLTFWQPPPYLVACSQAVAVDADGPVLVRNYDLDPRLSEATLLLTKWGGRRVMGMAEALAGLADGINEDGLAVSLAFGGEQTTREGFGIPIIVRYLLETCSTSQEAVAMLKHLPSHMAYNLTLIDQRGDHVTAFLRPGGGVEITRQRFATNHQRRVVWPENAQFNRTTERAELLDRLLSHEPTGAALAESFLDVPLYATRHAAGFGTVYTSVYRPREGSMALRWPGVTWHQSLADFRAGSRTITYPNELEPITVRAAGRPASATPGGASVPSRFWEVLVRNLEQPATADWSALAEAWSHA